MNDGMSYVGIKPCGCCVAICAIIPGQEKNTARTIAEWINEGLTIERKADAEAVSMFGRCKHKGVKK